MLHPKRAILSLKQHVGGGVDDAALAKEMNALSVQEREEVFDDIHGVSKAAKETPNFVKNCLQAFDKEMGMISARRRKTLHRAWFLCPTLETDKDWKLMFLRADSYNAAKAADRMIRYYDLKCQLFGEDKVVHRINLDDIEKDLEGGIASGFQVVLPYQDPCGRPLFFVNTSQVDLSRTSVDSVLRTNWYMTLAAMRGNEVAQKMGINYIVYVTGDLFAQHGISKVSEMVTRCGYLTTCVPCRYTSFRICYDDASLEPFVSSLRMAVGKFTRLRLTTHVGSILEHEYFLMQFGIPSKGLIQDAQRGDLRLFQQYLQRRAEIDFEHGQTQAANATVPYPQANDVLIGRGASYNMFPGNGQWEQLIATHVERYSQASNFEKTCISMEMVKTIQENQKGRFLQRCAQGWNVLDDASAREKAARAFRTRIKSHMKQETPQTWNVVLSAV